jgi:ATP-dependent Clp protease ATP-binding subunit ClpA
MQALLRPNLGFAAGDAERRRAGGMVDAELTGRMASAGMEAARRKFTPEFLNRIDKVVVFQPLGTAELRKVLEMELNMVQQRIFTTAAGALFVFSATEAAKDYLLREGTDLKYGARHLKRAVDRNLVHPLSNLMATEQVRGGDLVRVDWDACGSRLTFTKEAEDVAMQAMLQMVDGSIAPPPVLAAASAVAEPKFAAHAKGTRR